MHSPTQFPDARLATMAAALDAGTYTANSIGPGVRVQQYEVEEQIGAGGMGIVYAARHRFLAKRVAIKTLGATAPDQPVVAERFLREARALVALSGPSVVTIYDAGVYQGSPFFVMDLVDTFLDQTIDKGQLSERRALDLLEDLAAVLIRQERLGIVHRDIKPSNIFVQPSGMFALLDYGIVGSTHEGSSRPDDFTPFELENRPVTQGTGGTYASIGTPGFMDPHHLKGNAADHRSDLFGLGMTVWNALAGHNPFLTEDKASFGVFSRMLTIPVPSIRSVRPELSEDLSRILGGLTPSDPRERYKSARELLADIRRHRYSSNRVAGPILGRAFVALPFRKGFREVATTIDDTGARLGLRAHPVDRIVHLDDIWNQICAEIDASLCVIADLSQEEEATQPNANVVTEAAHARALGKPVILLSRDPPESLPFDWRHCPCIRYDPTPEGLIRLSETLERQLRHVCAEHDLTLPRRACVDM